MAERGEGHYIGGGVVGKVVGGVVGGIVGGESSLFSDGGSATVSEMGSEMGEMGEMMDDHRSHQSLDVLAREDGLEDGGESRGAALGAALGATLGATLGTVLGAGSAKSASPSALPATLLEIERPLISPRARINPSSSRASRIASRTRLGILSEDAIWWVNLVIGDIIEQTSRIWKRPCFDFLIGFCPVIIIIGMPPSCA